MGPPERNRTVMTAASSKPLSESGGSGSRPPEPFSSSRGSVHSRNIHENAALHLLASGCTVVALLASTSGSTAAPPTQVNAFNEVFNDLSNQVDNHVFTIPAGKRLAIDYVSAKGTVPARLSSWPRKVSTPRSVLFPFLGMSWFGWNERCSAPGPRPRSQ
jgi:hypothetical protein